MIYHVFANRSNIGDWLSAKGIQKSLYPHQVVECLCDKPFVNETIKILRKATENDLIIIGGGGLLMDYFLPFWQKFQPITEKVPFCIWGIGYCDLKQENSKPPTGLIEEIIIKSKLAVVRDELTISYLSNCKLPPPVTCPSINIITPLQEKGDDILHVVNYSTAGKQVYDKMCKAAQLFAQQTGRTYREVNNRISKGSEPEMEETLKMYRKSEFVLSSALHGCIIALAMGLKVLAVSGDRKIDAFMQRVGLEDWVLDITETDLIPERLINLHLQKDVRQVMEQIRGENKNIAEQILQKIH